MNMLHFSLTLIKSVYPRSVIWLSAKEFLNIYTDRLMSDIDIFNPPLTLIPNILGHLARGEQMLS